MPSFSSASLLHATARHEAGHAILAELFAGMRGITQPIIHQVRAFPDGSGGVHYVDTPDVPDPLKPRLCIVHTHDLLRAGSPFIWDASCDFHIAASQDAHNRLGPSALDKTLAAVARDIGLACGQPTGTAFDVDVLYDWLTVHEAIPPPGYNSPAYPYAPDPAPAPDGDDDDPAKYDPAAFFVGSLLAYAGYTDRRAIAADTLVVLAGPAAEGSSSIHTPAARGDRTVSYTLFTALHAAGYADMSTGMHATTRSEILQILPDVLNHPQIKDTRQGLEALLITNNIIAGKPYSTWAAKARGLATDFHDVRYVLNYALDTAETLLIPA